MRRFFLLLSFLGLALFASACGKPFKIQTAPGFVELENQGDYAYRATTPEGVVIAVRIVDDEERGDLDFWMKAITLQLRDVSGYALLDTADVTSLDGTKGKRMRFGHDEDNKPYEYVVYVFQAQGRLFIAETGATKELMDRARPSVDWEMKSLKVKCDSFVSPVLASRTCNRW